MVLLKPLLLPGARAGGECIQFFFFVGVPWYHRQPVHNYNNWEEENVWKTCYNAGKKGKPQRARCGPRREARIESPGCWEVAPSEGGHQQTGEEGS